MISRLQINKQVLISGDAEPQKAIQYSQMTITIPPSLPSETQVAEKTPFRPSQVSVIHDLLALSSVNKSFMREALQINLAFSSNSQKPGSPKLCLQSTRAETREMEFRTGIRQLYCIPSMVHSLFPTICPYAHHHNNIVVHPCPVQWQSRPKIYPTLPPPFPRLGTSHFL